jgi:hypothetical protein
MAKTLIIDQQSTVEALLHRSKRSGHAVPIRWTFVQRKDSRGRPQGGPLAGIVRCHDERSLDLYLLLRAVATAEPWNCAEDARIWARALGLVDQHGEHDIEAVSKAWRRLERHGLISRGRKGHRACVTVLLEDGTGTAYSPPTRTRGDNYLKLPFVYWTADKPWYRHLTLPEKALLLIALSLPKGFVLPHKKAPAWYGVSAHTAQRGLSGLQDKGLLHAVRVKKPAPLAPEGFTVE